MWWYLKKKLVLFVQFIPVQYL